MSDTTADTEQAEAPKASKLPLIIGIILMLVGAGGGFYAVSSGMLSGPLGIGPAPKSADAKAEEKEVREPEPLGDVAFVELEPLVISLSPDAQADFLRFRATIEVKGQYLADVEKVLPRVQDVMNTYLRALRPEQIEEVGSLIRIRSHLLHRVQVVIGEGRVNDLLIMEFVLN